MSHPQFTSVKENAGQLQARKRALFSLFDRIGLELEIPAGRYQEANKRYKSVSDWLHNCPDLGKLNPDIFPQGSFALGTTVRPLHGDEYDLDFIGHLEAAHPARYTQQQVYDMFFRRLREHATYKDMIELKKRCVRVRYANEFHLDITPAVTNPVCLVGSLLVPDRKHKEWKPSHPKGYADWFGRIANRQPSFSVLAKSPTEGRHITLASTEPLPAQRASKEVLRRAIQVMKRHRDVYAEKNPESAEFLPISIIITTLAAKAYEVAVGMQEYDSEFDLQHTTIGLMPKFLEGPDSRGFYRVMNPTNVGENFADKWQRPQYYQTFIGWHQTLQHDLQHLEKLAGTDALRKSLRETLGAPEVDRVFSREIAAVTQARPQQQVLVTTTAASIQVRPNTFFGR